jgi:hypothetical protein
MKSKTSPFEIVAADAAMRAIKNFAAMLHRQAPHVAVETLEACIYGRVIDGETSIAQIHEVLVRSEMIRPPEERLH